MTLKKNELRRVVFKGVIVSINNGLSVPPVEFSIRADGDSNSADESPAGKRCILKRDEPVFVEGDPCSHFYKVIHGTVRSLKLIADGRRQIDTFHLPGDLFGLEGGERHRFSAEAVDDVVVTAYLRSCFGHFVHHDLRFGDELIASMMTSMDRSHDHMVLLGRKTAPEKIASFLLDLADRLCQEDGVDLPMHRTDVADHLGLTIETVSRTFTQMAKSGLIRMTRNGRAVEFVDKAQLRRLSGRNPMPCAERTLEMHKERDLRPPGAGAGRSDGVRRGKASRQVQPAAFQADLRRPKAIG
jgi:CRP/FNR family nitrogen fixation transcriptional regulator